MEITQTAPRIKLRLVKEDLSDYPKPKEGKNKELVKKYRDLDQIGYELQTVRNASIRSCVTYYQLKKNGLSHEIPDIVKKAGDDDEITIRKYVTRFRPELETCPATFANLVEKEIITKYKNETKDYLTGKKSIPTFSDRKITFIGKFCKIEYIDNEYVYYPQILCRRGFVFKFVNTHKDKSTRHIVDRVLSGEYNMCDHFIKKDKNSGLWYLHLVYRFDVPAAAVLDKKICVGVDVGYTIPAVCAVNNSDDRLYCGFGETINRFKTQIRSRKRRMQKDGGKSGHGRKRLTEGLKKIKNYEANFIKDYNHKISKKIIEFAKKNNAGTIIIEDLNKGVKKQNKLLTINWSYYQLHSMISYKGKANGMEVIKIPPQYTSQTCSLCGYTDKANRRSQSEFVCIECGYKANADYNAAKNIANGGLNCTIKSDEAVVTAL